LMQCSMQSTATFSAATQLAREQKDQCHRRMQVECKPAEYRYASANHQCTGDTTVQHAHAALHLGEGCLCMFFCWGTLLHLHVHVRHKLLLCTYSAAALKYVQHSKMQLDLQQSQHAQNSASKGSTYCTRIQAAISSVQPQVPTAGTAPGQQPSQQQDAAAASSAAHRAT
jgi:hypothetical protein